MFKESWIGSNPVLGFEHFLNSLPGNMPRRPAIKAWLQARQDNGIRFPLHFQEKHASLGMAWEKPQPPGVVGLVVPREVAQPDRQWSLVVPLLASRSHNGGWSTTDNLPFRPADLQDILFRLLRSSGLGLDNAIPEAFPFALKERLGERSIGQSMTISGVLEVLRVWNLDSDVKTELLGCACSLVMRGEGERLVNVSSLELKLKGFLREHGRGTLVVCSPEAELEHSLAEHFDQVWAVKSLDDLAGRLCASGLLSALLRHGELTDLCLNEAERRARVLKEMSGPPAAVAFAQRLAGAVEATKVRSARIQLRASRILENVYRDLGNFPMAIAFAERRKGELGRLGDLASYEEVLDAESALASAHYDAYQFDRGLEVLEESLGLLRRQPRVAAAESRVAFFNTYARLLAVKDQPGWEQLFRESLALQETIRPQDLGRTRCYLINGLLRNGMLPAALQELEWFAKNPTDPFTKMFVAVYRAELFRLWPAVGSAFREDAILESGLFSRDWAESLRHPAGYYLVATARQPDRPEIERRERLKLAAKVFAAGGGNADGPNVLRLYSRLVSLVAQPENWEARQEVETYFAQPGCEGQLAWFGDCLSEQPLNAGGLLDRLLFI